MSIKKTAIYIRVSSDKQAQDGDSIGAQRDALMNYVNSRDDLVFAGEYLDDGVSGTKYQRDELQRLLDDVRADKVDLVLFTKLDRFFRSIRWYTKTQEILDRYNVGWTAIWEPIYDTTSPQGRLIVNQMMSIAQFEAENTGQRIRQVQAYKVTQGEVISGSVPWGYSIKDKHLVPNEYAEHVLRAFKTFSRTGSINGTLTETSGLKGLPRTHKHMKHMLSNPIYVGEYRGNRSFCHPIIPRDLWEDVQRQISINVKKSQKHTYIFSGLIRCAECGSSFSGDARKRVKNGKTITYLQYKCPKHSNLRPPLCGNKKVLTESVLEKYLVAELEKTVKAVSVEIKGKTEQDNSAQIAAVERKIARLKELYINDLISLDEYKRDKAAFLERLEYLQAKPKNPDMRELKALNGVNIKDLYATFSPQEKRRFWRSVIKVIRFGADRSMVIEYN